MTFDQWALLALIPLGATFLTWIVKTLMQHAVIMTRLTTELTGTNALALGTAAALATLTTTTASELARKLADRDAQIAATAVATAAELARKVEQTAADLAAAKTAAPDAHPIG
jgi:hypothetical protein